MSNLTPNQTVRYDVADGVATITLDRPDSLNSMTNEFMQDITAAFGFVEADDSVRVAILTGEGRGFCSGADLRNASSDGTADDADMGETTAAGMDDHFHPAVRENPDGESPRTATLADLEVRGRGTCLEERKLGVVAIRGHRRPVSRARRRRIRPARRRPPSRSARSYGRTV